MSLSTVILALNPIAYWKLNETSGTTAINYGSLGTGANGTYSGVTLAQIAAPGPNGGLAPYFDGDDFIDIMSATLAGGYNFSTNTILAWHQVATWNASASIRASIDIRDTNPVGSNQIAKHSLANQFYTGVANYSGTIDYVLKTGVSEAGWFLAGFTINKPGDELKTYYNGSQEGLTQTGIGELTTQAVEYATIGKHSTSGTNFWYGYLSNVAIFNYILTSEQIAAIYAEGIRTQATYSLTADAASIAVTGQDATLTAYLKKLGCVTAADTTLYTVTASDTCLYTVTASDMRCT